MKADHQRIADEGFSPEWPDYVPGDSIARRSPEARLWLSVLTQAVNAVKMARTPRGRRYQLAWFMTTSQAVGSFAWCCELFGFDAGAIRNALVGGTPLGKLGHSSVL
jgi:hypothetical protein